MAVSPGFHSRVVAVLKVGLPLIAVAMLAGLFLNSEGRRGQGELVFSPADLELLGAGMQVSRPVFSGVTEGLDRFRFTADVVTPDAAPPTRAGIETLTGRIEFANGPELDLQAATGEVDLETRRLGLTGGVAVETADGYVFRAREAEVDLDAGGLTAEGEVSGDGPLGRIDALRLAISPPQGADKARTFLFQENVRVVYDPPAASAPKADAPPAASVPQADHLPAASAPQADEPPAAPAPQAGETPAAPAPQAGETPAAPASKAGDAPDPTAPAATPPASRPGAETE